jgi:hypothetical protein
VNCDELTRVAAKAVLGLVGPEDLSAAANAALHGGLDSPSLIALTSADASTAGPLFDRTLQDFNMVKPSRREAVMLLARDAATEIVSGTISPYTGAKRIWRLTLRVPTEQIPELDPFIYAASEWEERPEDRVHFEEGIVSEARALVGR